METKSPIDEENLQSTMDPIVSNEDDEVAKPKKNNNSSDSATSSIGGSLNCDKIEKLEEKKFTIDAIPIEMLDEILCNLTLSDLVNCRLINRKWDEIATRIMCQRDDIQIVFSLIDDELTQNLECRPRQTLLVDFWPLVNTSVSSLTFSDLVECLKLSKNCPFRSFRFKDVVKSAEVESFLSIWGENIFTLGVKIEEDDDVETLRLFLEKTPNLQQLDITFDLKHFCYEKTIKSTAHLGSNKIQLSQLKTLRLIGSCDYFSGVIADILKEASNLNGFEHCFLDNGALALAFTSANDLIMLRSLNKLHCLKEMNLLFEKDLIELLEQLPQIMDLKLTSLKLSITCILNDNTLGARATTIINRIFHSSQNSLMELKITPLGTLSGLVIPKFVNLRKLSLGHDGYPGPSMFPPHFEMGDHFPNLLELSVAFLTEDHYFSTHQPLHVMPRVQLLRIVLRTEYDEKLMKLTPNVRTMLVASLPEEPPIINFKAIAKHLKKLENLGCHLFAKSLNNLQSKCTLDSVITGIPKKICKKMSAKFRGEVMLSPQTIAAMKKHRKNGSIVDVRGLKRFDISIFETHNLCARTNFQDPCSCLSSESSTDDAKYKNRDPAGFHHTSYFFKKCFTKVSKFLAFDLMPNLNVNIKSRCVR